MCVCIRPWTKTSTWVTAFIGRAPVSMIEISEQSFSFLKIEPFGRCHHGSAVSEPWLVSMRMRVGSLALLSRLRIRCFCKLWRGSKTQLRFWVAVAWVADTAQILSCCGCGAGWWLQLQLDPEPGNLHMPWVWPWKTKKKKKIKKLQYSLLEFLLWHNGN